MKAGSLGSGDFSKLYCPCGFSPGEMGIQIYDGIARDTGGSHLYDFPAAVNSCGSPDCKFLYTFILLCNKYWEKKSLQKGNKTREKVPMKAA